MTNSLVLVGRLTRTATLKYIGDKARANFTLAVDGNGTGNTSYRLICR